MEEAVKEIIERKTGKKISSETNLFDISDDSLGMMELIAEIEEKLKIRFKEQELLDLETVGDLMEVIRR
jgi:acyl carrier protein